MSFITSLGTSLFNPIGLIANGIRKSNGGDANQRVATYMLNNAPLGCDGTLTGCSFTGTQADFEAFRRDWIQQCTSANATNFTMSTNRTNNACQAAFDKATEQIKLENYIENEAEKNYIMNLLGKDSPMIYLIIILFVALIIYLLMSKK